MITYPLNNIDYNAEDAELFHCTRTSGIWAEESFPISVTGADNNVTIGKGIAWINNGEFSGKVAALKSAKTLDLGIADSTYPRIDVIAIQYSVNSNATDVVVKKGTPASSPVRPAIVRNGAVYELYLASVYRPSGATTITASNITDLRMDKTVCGLMADAVTKIDLGSIHEQFMSLVKDLERAIQDIEVGEVVPIEKGGTGAKTTEEALANIGGISIEKLWSNVNRTSKFAAQTIELNGEGCNLFILEYRSDAGVSSVVVSAGETAEMQMFANINASSKVLFCKREATISETTAIFGDSYGKNSETSTVGLIDNARLIPFSIYGIKGVRIPEVPFVSFIIDGTQYEAIAGTNWYTWANANGFYCYNEGDSVWNNDTMDFLLISAEGNHVSGGDIIKAGNYHFGTGM